MAVSIAPDASTVGVSPASLATLIAVTIASRTVEIDVAGHVAGPSCDPLCTMAASRSSSDCITPLQLGSFASTEYPRVVSSILTLGTIGGEPMGNRVDVL